jgi:hypothetical protein
MLKFYSFVKFLSPPKDRNQSESTLAHFNHFSCRRPHYGGALVVPPLHKRAHVDVTTSLHSLTTSSPAPTLPPRPPPTPAESRESRTIRAPSPRPAHPPHAARGRRRHA